MSGPHVHEMDEAAQFRLDLIPKFFELGPHGHRGAGGVRRQRRHHLHGGPGHRGAGPGGRLGRDLRGRAQYPGQQRPSPVGQQRAEVRATSPASPAGCSAPLPSPSRAAAAMPLPWPPGPSARATTGSLTGTEVLDHQRGRGRAVHRLRQRRPLQGLQGDHRLPGRARASPDSPSARRRTSWASGHRAPPS